MTYVKECWAEFKKVVWPKKDELKTDTFVVITGIIVSAAGLYAIGSGILYLFSKVI